MSLLEALKNKRNKLKPCGTIITTVTGEHFIEKLCTDEVRKLNIPRTYGYVVDEKPDLKPAEIISNFLYLGSQDAVTVDNINKYQLTHILSIGIICPIQDLPTKLTLLHVACLDLPETSLKQGDIIAKSFDFIENARSNAGKVLIHCNAGVSRSATVVIAYLMQYNKMDFDTAYKYVKSQRECIQPNAGFLKQLKEFKN